MQDHTQADKLSKIQKDLDETKIILHQVCVVVVVWGGGLQYCTATLVRSCLSPASQTIDSVLRRGEKLDALVDKSNDLSLASQMFYKQARKTNSCCQYM